VICCATGRPDCPVCAAVLTIRGREAGEHEREANCGQFCPQLTSAPVERRRCPVCLFCHGRHAPDCIASAGPATDRLIRFLEAR